MENMTKMCYFSFIRTAREADALIGIRRKISMCESEFEARTNFSRTTELPGGHFYEVGWGSLPVPPGSKVPDWSEATIVETRWGFCS